MREQMIEIVKDMVNHGYWLYKETIEEYVDRMINYGFTIETIENFRETHFKAKGLM